VQSYQFTLSLPPRGLHPNNMVRSRLARAAIFKKRKLAVTDLMLIASNFSRPLMKRVSLSLKFHVNNPRRDLDNLIPWIKADIDALQAANVLQNDNGIVAIRPEIVINRTPSGKADRKARQFYTMTITEEP
jgi:Holliday junction resolvase RusA-like endonuclease